MDWNSNFIFIGPQRTGTTWIYQHLLEHPDLCFPKSVKETMFFDRNYEKGLDWYKWHFSECHSDQRCGEVAPSYFKSDKVPGRIKKYFPNSKIIISLRDPVEKARSLFQHHYQKGRVPASFSKAIKVRTDILTSGYYKDHLLRWFNHFKEEQILVISMRGIKNNPEQLLEQLCDFLQIDKNILPNSIEKEKVNTAHRPQLQSLARLGSSLVTKLHSLRLHWIVNIAKRMGFKKLLFKKNGEKPGLTVEEKKFLEEEYAPHVEYVNTKFENISL